MGEREFWEFWAFFRMLPDGSFTKSAISEDEEVAKMRVDALSEEEIAAISDSRAETDDKPKDLPQAGYSLEIEKLNQVIDSLNELKNIVKLVSGNKVPKKAWRPTQRPKSAYDRLLDKRVWEYEKAYQEQAMSDFGF